MNKNIIRAYSLPIIGLLMGAAVGLVRAEATVWVIQGNSVEGQDIHGQFEQMITQPIKERTGGQLIIKLKPQGAITSNKAAFSATRYGKIDGFFMSPQYWGHVDVLFTLIGDAVAAWDSPAQFRAWLNNENGIRHLQRAYMKYDMYLVEYSLQPLEVLVSTRPLRNLDDIEGQMMRTPPGMVSAFFTKVGAKCRIIESAKVENAFKRKQITIADFSTLNSNHQAGLYRVARHTNYPGFHSMPMINFVVQKDRWLALSSEVQKIVKDVTAQWAEHRVEFLEAEDKRSLAILKKNGIVVHDWSDKEKRRARNIAASIWNDYASKSSAAKEMVESIKVWLSEYGNLD